MQFCKMLLATIGATLLMGAFAGGASARSFSTSSQTWRVAFRTLTFRGAFGNIRCSITLEGSLHTRTIAKTVGTLVGYITRADLGACETGAFTILTATLPWHVRYASFAGTLPAITAIRANIVGFAWQVREPAFTCLARSTAESPMVMTYSREGGGALTTAALSGTIPTSCGLAGSFESTADPVTVLNSIIRITVTLI